LVAILETFVAISAVFVAMAPVAEVSCVVPSFHLTVKKLPVPITSKVYRGVGLHIPTSPPDDSITVLVAE